MIPEIEKPKMAFSIFGIPTPKGRPRFFRRGKFVSTYTPDATRIAEQDFKNQAMKYKPEKPLECPLKITLRFYKPRPKSKPKKELYWTSKADLDNLIKVVDSLNGIFWKDDSQIIEIHASKAYDDNARTDVEIYEII
jgi:Holliday junction resolvase RusA-like endonuclease